uniref:Uncharacterized protein n=1 Tax=viral metagenome TaxID=1070528 RepID=A0A6H2A2V2_9ZZZZ
MTGLEQALSGVAILMGGGVLGRLLLPCVSHTICAQRHKALDQLVFVEFDNIKDRLARIEAKIDKNNDRGA